jgi:class 3 adenylate cyclase
MIKRIFHLLKIFQNDVVKGTLIVGLVLELIFFIIYLLDVNFQKQISYLLILSIFLISLMIIPLTIMLQKEILSIEKWYFYYCNLMGIPWISIFIFLIYSYPKYSILYIISIIIPTYGAIGFSKKNYFIIPGFIYIALNILMNFLTNNKMGYLFVFSNVFSVILFSLMYNLSHKSAYLLYSKNRQLLLKSRKFSRLLEEEKTRSETLLLNILPKKVAYEMKTKGKITPEQFKSVTVIFTDFVDFTKHAEKMSAIELINDLDLCFSSFDSISRKYNLEKIKTIGDSYMTCGGIPILNMTHPIDSVSAALEFQSYMDDFNKKKQEQKLPLWNLRLGIHTGSLVAGVIGQMKFSYDVWGDTVNSASRMESSGTPGMINISGSTFALVKDVFDCEYRGKINAKNKGEVEMYYVKGLNVEFASQSDHRIPNKNFWKYYSELERTNF